MAKKVSKKPMTGKAMKKTKGGVNPDRYAKLAEAGAQSATAKQLDASMTKTAVADQRLASLPIK